MSLDRCLELIAQCYDRDKDLESLVEELAEMEGEIPHQETPEDYQEPLGEFLVRVDEILSEDEPNQRHLDSAIRNFRGELETLKRKRVPKDPLEHLFVDMARYEAGTLSASGTLSTLSRYEALVLGMRDHFEQTTDPTNQSPLNELMRSSLQTLEAACKRLRVDLNNDLDYAFEEIREEFREGKKQLRKFRRTATFEKKGEEIDA